jgi:hypothetical protein
MVASGTNYEHLTVPTSQTIMMNDGLSSVVALDTPRTKYPQSPRSGWTEFGSNVTFAGYCYILGHCRMRYSYRQMSWMSTWGKIEVRIRTWLWYRRQSPTDSDTSSSQRWSWLLPREAETSEIRIRAVPQSDTVVTRKNVRGWVDLVFTT